MNSTKPSLKNIFLDLDQDGIIDALDLQIHLLPSATRSMPLSAVMDFCACLGFETMALNLPVVTAAQKRSSFFQQHLYIGTSGELEALELKRKKGDYFLTGSNGVSLAKATRDWTSTLINRRSSQGRESLLKKSQARQGFDLLNPFSIKGFFTKPSKGSLPMQSPYKIVLLSDFALETAAQAGNFAVRLGLETVHLSLPMTLPFEKRDSATGPRIYIGLPRDLKKIKPQLSKERLTSPSDTGIFLLPSNKTIPDVLICGPDETLAKILQYLSLLATDSRGSMDPLFSRIRGFLAQLKEALNKKKLPLQKPVPQKIVRKFLIPDERKEIRSILRQEFKKHKPGPYSVKIQISMARPLKTRKAFETELRELLTRFGFKNSAVSLSVLNAYKPGLSWLREVVLRKIAKKKIDRIEIAFKKFQLNGLEEPIRWLQELYPIDEILSSSLSISKDKIEFKMDPEMKEIYRIRAWRRRKLAHEETFSPRWSRQNYLHGFPRLGHIHPCTGWIRVQLNGTEVIHQPLKTGPERIWEIYQKELLALISREALPILSGQHESVHNGIFEEIRFDVYFDYPGEPLKVDEERISPLEALHEDLYFVTLDFLSRLAKKHGQSKLSAGRVLPVIRPVVQTGPERLIFTLLHITDSPSLCPEENMSSKLIITGLLFHKSKTGVELLIQRCRDKDSPRIEKLVRSISSVYHPAFKVESIISDDSQNQKEIRMLVSTSSAPKKISPVKKPLRKPLSIPLHRPIGYREGLKIMQSLQCLPGVNVIAEGRSTGGLPIFSIENIFPPSGAFISHAKRVQLKPTFFLNCRHHANEVSSSSAGLKLAHLLATDPDCRALLKKVNVIINPMENVDGVVILEEMLQLTPTDKLHAGRYNQAGREYYAEYFDPSTPFGEARTKPALWQRWLPDVCSDNHGFPSHEWEQPFSGYAPVRFRDWWIPRSLYFIYLPYLEEKAGSPRRALAESLKGWINQAFRQEKKMRHWNRVFSERYWKYRGQWLQKDLPNREEIQSFPLQNRFRQTNFSYRYPQITSIDMITEVADETAQGEFLKTCINAHLQCNLAIIKWLNSNAPHAIKISIAKGLSTEMIWHRERL